MKNIAAASAVLVLATAVFAADAGRIVSDKKPLKAGETVRVDVDRGSLTIGASTGSELTYEVRFEPETGLFAEKPTAADYQDCVASYTVTEGLKVRSSPKLQTKVSVFLPAVQALASKLGGGKTVIAARSGSTSAEVGAGTLEFDGSGLPEGVCVDAWIKKGSVTNTRDKNCRTTPAILRVDMGSVLVK